MIVCSVVSIPNKPIGGLDWENVQCAVDVIVKIEAWHSVGRCMQQRQELQRETNTEDGITISASILHRETQS